MIMVSTFDGVEVSFIGINDVTENEPKNYVEYVRAQTSDPIKSIQVVQCDDGMVDVNYELQGEKFERIRRITGYLTGSLDSWNDAKQSEEHDRVKHAIIN